MKRLDWVVICCIGLLMLWGVATIYSASSHKQEITGKNFVLDQVARATAGIVLCGGIVRLGYHTFLSSAYFWYAGHVVLLLSVLMGGHTVFGAQRWIRLGPVSLQPSEFAKIAAVLVLARFLGDYPASVRRFSGVVMPLALAALPIALIMAQPDLGTGIVLVPVVVVMLWIAGIRTRWLAGAFLLVVALLPVGWHTLRDYQKERVMVFLSASRDPLGTGYTITQSKISLGSGMLFGKGWVSGTQNRLNFLPERHTDFIFSVVGEEWGFFGCCGVIALLWTLLARGMAIAAQTRERSGRLLAAGLTTLLAVHVIINIGMTLGLAPVVGLPLPFISYGGSALITNLIAAGFILSVHNRRTIF